MNSNLVFPGVLLFGLLALAGCDSEAKRQAQAAAAAAEQEQAAAQLAREYDSALQGNNWEMARIHGAALLAQYPDSQAAAGVAPGYDEVKAKAEETRELRRMEALWHYAQVATEGGIQRSAMMYSKDPVDVDGSGAHPVQLVFRDHPKWERSSYLVLQASDFRCARGCKVKVAVDGGEPKAMDAWRPDTDEAIAMFISDQKALWKLLRQSKVASIEFPVKEGGTRTAVFEVGGLDGSQMPGWD